MQSRFLTLTLALVLALVALPAMAQVTEYSDVPTGTQPIGGPPASVDQIPEGGLTFYNVLADFEAAAPGLPTEDFSNNLIGPGGVCSDLPPLDDATNDACFAAGSVIPGFELDIILLPPNSGQYVLLTEGFLGIGINAVGPNSFPESTNLRFDPPVNAVGFDLIGGLINPVTTDVIFYDSADQVIGSTSASGSVAGMFFGATSETPIARVEMVEPVDGGELFGNLTFGAVAPPTPTIEVPTLGQYGFAALMLLLIGTGVFFLRRR